MKKYILLIGALALLFSAQAQKVNVKVKPLTKTQQLQKTIDSLQTVCRVLNADNDNCVKQIKRKDGQLSNKQRQINNLKADTIRLYKEVKLQTGLYDECLDSYMVSIGYLQDISFILGDKKRPRKKLILIGQIINQASHTE